MTCAAPIEQAGRQADAAALSVPRRNGSRGSLSAARGNAALRRAFVLAHFDPDGIFDPHVRATVASVAKSGAEVIVVSTNLVPREDLAGTGVSRVLRRENAGYDFRSWQAGLRELGDLDRYDEIVLCNDSFYLAREDGIAQALEAVEQLSFDVGSLTASYEFGFHLQSYFMVFRRSAFRTEWFERFWDGVSRESDRDETILRCELPLARQAISAGLGVRALLNPSALPTFAYLAQRWSDQARERGRRGAARAVLDSLRGSPARNPMLDDWTRVASRCGVVKVELVRSNPRNADLSELAAFMEPACLARARSHAARTSGAAACAARRG